MCDLVGRSGFSSGTVPILTGCRTVLSAFPCGTARPTCTWPEFSSRWSDRHGLTATGGPVLGLRGLPTTKLERVLGMPTLSYKKHFSGWCEDWLGWRIQLTMHMDMDLMILPLAFALILCWGIRCGYPIPLCGWEMPFPAVKSCSGGGSKKSGWPGCCLPFFSSVPPGALPGWQ